MPWNPKTLATFDKKSVKMWPTSGKLDQCWKIIILTIFFKHLEIILSILWTIWVWSGVVCLSLRRCIVFRPDDALKKRSSWFPDWIPKVQKCANDYLINLKKKSCCKMRIYFLRRRRCNRERALQSYRLVFYHRTDVDLLVLYIQHIQILTCKHG